MAERAAISGRTDQMITPAEGRQGQTTPGTRTQGYATHTGEARSTEDVTIRNGTAPILERGEGDDTEIEDALADAIPASGNAPD
jgi:hypothetical protein